MHNYAKWLNYAKFYEKWLLCMKNGIYAKFMHNDYEKWLGCAYYAQLCKIMKTIFLFLDKFKIMQNVVFNSL